MDQIVINILNGISSGLLLFMLSSGLTLIFSMMGVLNFAHASFYMLGAYIGYSVSQVLGFWPALLVAPLIVGALARTESRGGHAREDYQTRDDENFMVHTMAYREEDEEGSAEVRLDYKPVVVTRYQPMERKY